MAELKTKQNDRSVEEFLDGIVHPQRRRDCYTLLDVMKRATRAEPRMWGESIVGFGAYHYKYQSGREGDWFLVGFSPRKQNLTIYIMSGFDGCAAILNRLGKFKTGKCCLYVKSLEDIDLPTLTKLLKRSVKELAASSVAQAELGNEI